MSGNNSAYSPLPQSNSDSDGSSEEELHVLQDNEIISRAFKTQNSKTEKLYNGKKPNVINYKPLDMDKDIGVTLMKFQSTSNEVSILKPNKKIEIISTSRKICFVFSLLLCVLTTIVFIWILPCNVSTCLSKSVIKNEIKNWDTTLSGLELYGPISLVSDSLGRNSFVVLLLRSPNSFNKSIFKSGLISLKTKNGVINWQTTINKLPIDIDCHLVDMDLDGFNDCLLRGSNFFKAIHALSGMEIWDIQDSNKNFQFSKLDFPIVLPDLDNDDVKEYLTSSSFTYLDKKIESDINYQNNLLVISGKTGNIINNPFKITSCSAVHNLMFENSSVISYTCYNSTEKESVQTISFSNILKTVKSISKKKLNYYKWENLKQHKKDQIPVQVNGHRLIIENKGQCPENCTVSIDVKDEREELKNKSIISHVYKNAYGMIPVELKSKNTGFIIKLWKWHSREENPTVKIKTKFSKKILVARNISEEKIKKNNSMLNNVSNLDKEMFFESLTDIQRYKRTADLLNNKKTENSWESNNIILRIISESIIGIIFNGNQPVLRNITEDEIIQICRKGHFCEPDIDKQKYSMIVADLDEDNQEKLISFSSKYVYEKDGKSGSNNESWNLQSKVRVISF